MVTSSLMLRLLLCKKMQSGNETRLQGKSGDQTIANVSHVLRLIRVFTVSVFCLRVFSVSVCIINTLSQVQYYI